MFYLLRQVYSQVIFSFFDAMVNGIVSINSPSDSSLLVYRNAIDLFTNFVFCSLLNSLMSSSIFLVVSLGFSMYSIM